MPRISYFVHGRGRGHAVRTRAILPRLANENLLRLYCAGRAYDLLGEHPAAEEVLTCSPGRGMARAFALRLRADRQRLRAFKPHLVVSDGDGPSVNAAWSLGVPVLAVGHGLVFRHAHLPRHLSVLARLREMANASSSSWPALRRVLVHFTPITPVTPGTMVARPDLDVSLEPKGRRDDFVLAYFRDDDGIEAVERLASRGHRVLLFGRPTRHPRGVEVLEPSREAFARALPRCRAVVGSAGNHLPAECAMLGLPMLALHRDGDFEQTMNARLIEEAGIGFGVAFRELDDGLLRRFEHEFDRDRSAIAERTFSMRPVSEVIPAAIQELCRPAARSLRPSAYAGADTSSR